MQSKGQSTVEYIILVAAVIAVAIIFLGPTGAFKSKLGDSLNIVADDMLNVVNRVLPP